MRMRSSGAVLVGAVVTALVLAGCAESSTPSAPARVEQSGANILGLGELLGLQTAEPITRTVPLGNDVTWSFTVGAGGATSSNSTVGLTIRVPAGAVDGPTTITVTALKGAEVAYQFQPHGLQFNRRVTLTQKLQGTSVGSQLLPFLKGAYFPTDELILDDGLALVSELLFGVVSPLTNTFSFDIEHFSGYIVVSGRSGSADAQ